MDVAYQLDVEWPLLARGKVARALPRWQKKKPELRAFGTPHQLMLVLHSAPAEETDGPLLALLALARHDRLAGRVLLQVLLPALKTRADRIVHPAHAREEVWELLLYSAWETICSYPIERRRLRVAANLVLQVVHRTTRALRHPSLVHDDNDEPELTWLRPSADEDGGEPERAARLEEGVAPAGRVAPEAVVLAGVAAGVISPEDADLILLTRVDGIRLAVVARTQGVGYHALRQRRQRAEIHLRQLLSVQGDVSKRPVLDPVSYGGAFLLHARRRASAATAIDPAAARAA